MLYMVIERFTRGADPVYERAAELGRQLPDGLSYVDSWVDERRERCFQLMETDDPRLFDEWIEKWADLAEFEVVPVMTSAEAAAISRTPSRAEPRSAAGGESARSGRTRESPPG